MDISIITPFYNGNRFMPQLTLSVKKAINELEEKYLVEHIIVNDSPSTNVDIPEQANYNITVVNNKVNRGIHQSRVNGLQYAKGEFIVFLDQDDIITPRGLNTQLEKVKENDLCIGNGFFMLSDGNKRPIYKNNKMMTALRYENPYIYVRDLIVSPGQVIIRKSSLPIEWENQILKENGTDDYLLWLLMFKQNKKITVNEEFVYIHNDSGENLSFDLKKMERSLYELLLILKRVNYSSKKTNLLRRRIKYKNILYESKWKFSIASLYNIDIFLYNLYFRIFYGGNVVSYKGILKKQ